MFARLGPGNKTFVLGSKPFECRFCGGKPPERTFKKRHMLFPSFSATRFLKSRYECDACNERFSGFEDDLAKMTIPTRSIGGSLARTASRNFWHKAPGLHAWNSRTAHCICLRTPEILACRGRSEQNPHLHICRASLSPARGVQGAMQISIRVAAERRAEFILQNSDNGFYKAI